jgi:AcrR family transcriptional regulator
MGMEKKRSMPRPDAGLEVPGDPGFLERDSGFRVYEIHGRQYKLPLVDDVSATKERLLMSASIMFARKGYAAVSIRDIARANGLKPSSIYNHFQSKEALWAAVLEHFKKTHLFSFGHLEKLINQARTFEEVLEHLFYEPRRLNNHYLNHGFSLITTEQVNDPLAAEAFHFIFKYSIDFIKKKFDDCVARGLVQPFDTQVVASLIMSTVHICIIAKVQEFEGGPVVFQAEKVAADLERFILWATGQKPAS